MAAVEKDFRVKTGLLVEGNISAIDYNSTSDERLKTNISKIENGIDVIKELNGVDFEWKYNGKKTSGVIAQQVQKILPNSVSETDEGILKVNYSSIIAYLIESIKELNEKIELLERKVDK
jgi:hypothetical protein